MVFLIDESENAGIIIELLESFSKRADLILSLLLFDC